MLRLLCLSIFALPLAAGLLKVSILDESGRPAAARVYLTSSSDETVFAPGTILYNKVRPDGQQERHFVPRGGSFSVTLAGGRYELVVERGKEYVPVRETVAVPDQGTVSRMIRLRRWTNMAARGWYSGDMHLHRPLADIAVLMEAEDLNFAVPISRWRHTGPEIASDAELDAMLERAGSSGVLGAGPNRFYTVLNEELEPRNAALLVSRLGRRGSDLRYPLAAYGLALAGRGAVVDSEKATQLELPVHAALGACQTVGLANNHFWRSGFYAGPWGVWPDEIPRERPRTCAGFALAGMDIYYALLNAGFPLRLSAGSASGVHPVPPGWSRVYVRAPGKFTAEGWYEALEAGRSFVTTGPMIFLDVDGHSPGDEVPGGDYPRGVKAEVRMLSLQPVAAAEVVVNGRTVQVQLAPERGVSHSFSGSAELELAGTSWMAARWVGEREKGCDVAHTAPVYFRNGDEAVPLPKADKDYLLARVKALIREVETGRQAGGRPTTIPLPNGQVKQETLRLFQRAREVLAQR